MIRTFLTANWRLLAYLLSTILGVLVLTQLATTCGTRQPAELSRRAERRAVAHRDSAMAAAARYHAQAEAAATHADAVYDSARIYQDSATYYHDHAQDIITVPASDTAGIQRGWASLFQ